MGKRAPRRTLDELEGVVAAARAAQRAVRATRDPEALRLATNAYARARYNLPKVKEAQAKQQTEYLSRPGVKEAQAKQQTEYLSRPGVKEKKAKRQAEYYQQNREALCVHNAEYQRENKEAIAEQRAEHYLRPEVKEARVEYYARPEVKERRNKRQRERIATDSQFRLASRLRCRQYTALRGNLKAASTLELLGCSYEEANAHIESLFTEGMSWDNYGEWEYDHIIPIASFDLTDPEQQRAAFHYTNLQPLWVKDNRNKRAKLNWSKES